MSFGMGATPKNSDIANGGPNFHAFSAAFVYIFHYLLKCCLLEIFNKIIEKWLYLMLDVSKYVKKCIGEHSSYLCCEESTLLVVDQSGCTP